VFLAGQGDTPSESAEVAQDAADSVVEGDVEVEAETAETAEE
jgi:hypothetical protein